MNYNNYSISASKGKLYLKSKTPQEGYEKVTYGANGENTTYHKYVDSIIGNLKRKHQNRKQTIDLLRHLKQEEQEIDEDELER